MTKDEALKLALEALEEVDNCIYINDYGDYALDTAFESNKVDYAVTAIREALAQPQQEFVCSTGLCHYRKPLTNEEIDYWIGSNSTKKALARAIEAAHGIKGHA